MNYRIMRITNKYGTVVADIESWEKSFKEVDDAKHWEEGRSAMSLAQYFSLPNIEQSNGMKTHKRIYRNMWFQGFRTN